MAEKIIGLTVIADEEITLETDEVIKGDKGDIYIPFVDDNPESETYGYITWVLMRDPLEEDIKPAKVIGPEGKVFTPVIDEVTGNITWKLENAPAIPKATNIRGPQGFSGTMQIGTVTTGAADTDAVVTNVGTPENAILNITIPQGVQGIKGDRGGQGPSGTQSIGEVTTSQPGTNATITNAGTAENAIWNISIPRGDKGDKGDKGETGSDLNVLDAYDTVDELYNNHSTGNPGDAYFVGNDLYVWSETLNDWKNTGVTNGTKYGAQIHRWEATD